MEALSSSTATATATASAATTSRNKLDADYQSFLKLLIAQVSNQDPLEPMDSTTFVSQLAQLTQVEQSITTNDTLEKIEARLSSANAREDAMLIGREVLVPTDRIALNEGTAKFSYTLNSAAASVSARILGEDGTELRRIDGLPGGQEGRHEVIWDGRDREGLPVPDGAFQVEINALDADDKAVFLTTYAEGQVERVAFRDGSPVLQLASGAEVSPDSIVGIR
ncbi:flagellar hook capping FlgD N-terminal domain-containing protein [uncultured Limimaricola sp.]|uniref:flagellar hook assembly protein FlgD n=1 Tax=uncultured Limimaricola sp. TaxID=2211667 RepID=UPI0030F70055